MANVVVSIIIAGALFLAVRKLVIDKKNGVKCTGCPAAGKCSSKQH